MVPTPVQNRKYLCSAPRPEVWDDISGSVLERLGLTTAAAQITETLDKLRSLHHLPSQPRSGPGRKSNAEHAINFYEHLLELLATDEYQRRIQDEEKKIKNSKTKSNSKKKSLSSTDAIVADQPSHVVENNSKGGEATTKDGPEEAAAADNNNANEERDDDEEEEMAGENVVEDDDDDGNEVVSMDTPTFNAQHNDLCEVCEEAGELLMCSTCNLVFHLECVRPKMETLPLDNDIWRCSHCILQSNPKKSSKLRRQAAAAVRLMARLRKQHQYRKQQQQQLHQQLEQENNGNDKTMNNGDSTETQPLPPPAVEQDNNTNNNDTTHSDDIKVPSTTRGGVEGDNDPTTTTTSTAVAAIAAAPDSSPPPPAEEEEEDSKPKADVKNFSAESSDSKQEAVKPADKPLNDDPPTEISVPKSDHQKQNDHDEEPTVVSTVTEDKVRKSPLRVSKRVGKAKLGLTDNEDDGGKTFPEEETDPSSTTKKSHGSTTDSSLEMKKEVPKEVINSAAERTDSEPGAATPMDAPLALKDPPATEISVPEKHNDKEPIVSTSTKDDKVPKSPLRVSKRGKAKLNLTQDYEVGKTVPEELYPSSTTKKSKVTGSVVADSAQEKRKELSKEELSNDKDASGDRIDTKPVAVKPMNAPLKDPPTEIPKSDPKRKDEEPVVVANTTTEDKVRKLPLRVSKRAKAKLGLMDSHEDFPEEIHPSSTTKKSNDTGNTTDPALEVSKELLSDEKNDSGDRTDSKLATVKPMDASLKDMTAISVPKSDHQKQDDYEEPVVSTSTKEDKVPKSPLRVSKRVGKAKIGFADDEDGKTVPKEIDPSSTSKTSNATSCPADSIPETKKEVPKEVLSGGKDDSVDRTDSKLAAVKPVDAPLKEPSAERSMPVSDHKKNDEEQVSSTEGKVRKSPLRVSKRGQAKLELTEIDDVKAVAEEVDPSYATSSNTTGSAVDATPETKKEMSKKVLSVVVPTESGERSGKKRSLSKDMSGTSDTVVAATTTTTPSSEMSSPGGRSKRCRKQPMLYDPQQCPASRWQTDEFKEWKASRVEASGDGSDHPVAGKTDSAALEDKKLTPEEDAAAAASGSKSGRRLGGENGIWCSFCHDDPDVPVCVFCACRVCFGKHNQTKLLLCDLCDEEFHTFCLDPPLSSVPVTQKWYCPTCAITKADAAKTESPRSPRRTVVVERVSVRTKSREPAPTSSGAASAAATTNSIVANAKRQIRTPSPKRTIFVVATAPAETKKASKNDKKPTGRPRGRPPKNPVLVAAAAAAALAASAAASSAASKKRDRSPSKARSVSEPPRKRGRPPSAATIAKRQQAEAEARKAARLAAKSSPKAAKSSSKKSDASVAASTASASVDRPIVTAEPVVDYAPTTVVPVVPVTVSRSGRMVRRSSFHDERHEGAQHLKTIRHNVESNVNTANEIIAAKAERASPASSAASMNSMNAAYTGNVIALSSAAVDAISNNLTAAAARSFAQAAAASQNSAMATTPTTQLKDPPSASNNAPAQYDDTWANSFQDVNQVDSESSHPYSDSTGTNQGVAMGVQSTAAIPGSAQAYMQSLNQNRGGDNKQPRRKPGARECMQISRRFGVKEIPQQYIDILMDYCTRGKVEHLIRMRERLDEHSRFLESQLAGLEALVLEHGETDIEVPLAPPSPDRKNEPL